MKNIVILGSTGSIGKQTLDVIRALPDQFKVVGLAAGQNRQLLEQQTVEFQPSMVWAEVEINDQLRRTPIAEMVQDPIVDVVMVATTGRAGLSPTLEALRSGKAVAIANKEVIIMAGELICAVAREHGGVLLPVDSEPSAVWQCIKGEEQPIKRIIITASGGPFRRRSLHELGGVTPAEALAHPTWVMGPKITVDSATLMNKGFEVIESHWLFNMPFDQIEVVIHPQSIIHSMVELADGSIKAQLSPPDMRLPIQHALFYPDRIPNHTLERYEPLRYPSLTFEELELSRYPCFALALEAGRAGYTYPCVLSAADEEAVHLFLQGRIGFRDIQELVARTLDDHRPGQEYSLGMILEADAWARRRVGELTEDR